MLRGGKLNSVMMSYTLKIKHKINLFTKWKSHNTVHESHNMCSYYEHTVTRSLDL